MKWRNILLIVVSALFLFGVVLISVLSHHSAQPSKGQPPLADKASAIKVLTDASTAATNWPDDPRQEVRDVYQFARIAKVYNFDPHVIYYDKDKSIRNTMDVITKTHSAEVDILHQRIRGQYSYHDDSYAPIREVDLDPAELRKSWADCVGTWNKQEMIDETIRILRELGYTEYLAIAQNGKFEFKIHDYLATTPDGQQITIHPFATVKVLDAHSTRITAEYRMGTNGQPAGLTHWMAQ